MTTLTTTPTTTDDELFSNSEGLRAYLTLDIETGELAAGLQQSDCMLARTFHGILLRWAIPALTVDGVARFMAAVAPNCQAVLNDSSIKWDGNNHVGQLGDIADLLSDQIWFDCDGSSEIYETYQEWAAADWFEPVDALDELGLSASSTDEEIAAATAAAIRDAESDGYHLGDDVEEYLLGLRDEARDEEDEDDD